MNARGLYSHPGQPETDVHLGEIGAEFTVYRTGSRAHLLRVVSDEVHLVLSPGQARRLAQIGEADHLHAFLPSAEAPRCCAICGRPAYAPRVHFNAEPEPGPDPTWPVRVPASYTDGTGAVVGTTLEIAAGDDPVAAGLAWARASALAPLRSLRVNGREVPLDPQVDP